jgi:sugar phosphate isomerase/epimerase
LSVNGLSFGASALDEDIAACRQLGVHQYVVPVAKLESAGWDAGVAALGSSGLVTASLLHPGWFSLDDPARWPDEQAMLKRSIDAADALGASAVYGTTGKKGALTWEAAADRFAEAVAPVAAWARAAGIDLTLETTNPLFADLSFLHCLPDALEVAEASGLALCVDLFVCWTDRGLRAAIERCAPRCPLVQVSDYVLGGRSMPTRAVPGDGDIPLAELVGWVLASSFAGVFDLELMGPRIDEEGPLGALRRAGEWMGALLDAGAPSPPRTGDDRG